MSWSPSVVEETIRTGAGVSGSSGVLGSMPRRTTVIHFALRSRLLWYRLECWPTSTVSRSGGVECCLGSRSLVFNATERFAGSWWINRMPGGLSVSPLISDIVESVSQRRYSRQPSTTHGLTVRLLSRATPWTPTLSEPSV